MVRARLLHLFSSPFFTILGSSPTSAANIMLRLQGLYRTRTGRTIGGPKSNENKPAKPVPPGELIKRKAKRCTVSIATEPSWTITVEAKNAGDQSSLSQHLNSDMSLAMAPSWTGSTPPESDIKRRIERLETLRRQLGLTLVLPEITVGTSQAVDTSESEASSTPGDPPSTAARARPDDPDDDEILSSWEDDVSDDEVPSAEQA